MRLLWLLIVLNLLNFLNSQKIADKANEFGLNVYYIGTEFLSAVINNVLTECIKGENAAIYPYNNEKVFYAYYNEGTKTENFLILKPSSTDPEHSTCNHAENLTKTIKKNHPLFTKDKFSKAFMVFHVTETGGEKVYQPALVYGADVEKNIIALPDVSVKITKKTVPHIPSECFVDGKHCVYDYYPTISSQVKVVNSDVVGFFCDNIVKYNKKQGYSFGHEGALEHDREIFGQGNIHNAIFTQKNGTDMFNPSKPHNCVKFGVYTPDDTTGGITNNNHNNGRGGVNSPGNFDTDFTNLQCGPLSNAIPSVIVGVVLVVFIIIAIVLLMLERKGKAKKEAYLRVLKANKKDEKGTEGTETQGTENGTTQGDTKQ